MKTIADPQIMAQFESLITVDYDPEDLAQMFDDACFIIANAIIKQGADITRTAMSLEDILFTMRDVRDILNRKHP